MAGDVHGRGRVYQGGAWQGGVHGRGIHGRGACVVGGMCGRGHAYHAHPLPDTTATAYGLRAGGTHPTGMHSCLFTDFQYD